VSFQALFGQSDFLQLLDTGDGKALLQYKSLTFYGRWCWWLKTYIDKLFVKRFQSSAVLGA